MKGMCSLISRYCLILLVGLFNLKLFYFIFTPLTFFSVSKILTFFGQVTILGDIILFNSSAINLVAACIAGSAYYLFFILALSTRNLAFKKYIYLILYCFGIFYFVNVLRIVFMAFIIGATYFNFTHLFFWYFTSLLLVVLIWFSAVKTFKIASVPIYSDINYLIKQIK